MVIFKAQNTLGDKLHQHIAATHCNDKFLCVYWRICENRCLCNRIFSPQQVKSHKFKSKAICSMTKFCCRDKDFHKNSPVHIRFVVATCHTTCCLTCTQPVICHCDMLQQCVNQCVPNFRFIQRQGKGLQFCPVLSFCVKKKIDQRTHACVPSESFSFLIHWQLVLLVGAIPLREENSFHRRTHVKMFL